MGKRKGLCIAVMAMLAIWAVVSPAAQAQTFEWASGTTKLDLTQDPIEPSQLFTVLGGAVAVTCNEVHATVNVSGTSSTQIETSGLTFQNSGSADECPWVIFKMNGCNYRFNATSTLAAGEVTATVDVICPEGNEIQMNISGCTFRIPGGPANEGLEHVVFRTVAGSPETVTGQMTITGIHYTSGLLCSKGTFEDATLNGKFTLTGTDAGGSQTDVTVT